jgi:PAS domain S-box-containing protein
LAALCQKPIWRALLDQGRVRLETKERKLDGTAIWIEGEYICLYDDHGHVVGHFGIQRDITSRQQAGERLRHAEQKYRSLFEEAPAMYVITAVTDSGPIIADCNELFLSTLGYSRQEVINRHLADFYTPDSRYELLEAGGYQQALGGKFVQQERRFVAKNRRIIETLLRAMPEFDAQGQLLGTRAMYVDITGQRRLEEQLRQAQKLEAVG